MTRKQPEVTEQTRKKLEDAFWKLYAEKPIEKISIREITELAGYNRSTFYLYYRSTVDILEQREEILINERCKFIEKHFTGRSLRDDLRIEARSFLEQTRSEAQYFKVLLGPHGDQNFIAKINDFGNKIMSRYKDGPYPSNLSPEQVDYLIAFYNSGKLGIARKWLNDPAPMSVDELVNLVVGLLLHSSPRMISED